MLVSILDWAIIGSRNVLEWLLRFPKNTLCSHNRLSFPFKVMFSSLLLISQHQSCSVKVERHKHANTEKIIRRNSSQRTKEPFTRAKVIRRPVSQPQIGKAKLDMTETKILQSLLRRFPSALAEINKRLTSQNLLWFTLDTRARR